MLTGTIRPLSAVREFIVDPSLCIARVTTSVPHPTTLLQTRSSHTPQCTKYYSNLATRSPKGRLESREPSVPVPYALKAAAQAFEEQVLRREQDFIVESYTHLRQVVIRSRYRGLVSSDDRMLPRLLQSPEDVFKDAMALLVTSSRREHADLHLNMFNDLASVFHCPATLDSPFEFTVKMFHAYLDAGAFNSLSHIYDHLRHLFEAIPSGWEAYVSNSDVKQRVATWMRCLAKVPRREHAKLLCRLLRDLPGFFHIRPTLTHHQYVIKGFLGAGMPDDAWTWLQQMEQRAPMPPRSAGQPSWLTRLLSFASSGDNHPAPEAHSSSLTIWIKPRSQEYDIFLYYFARYGDTVSMQSLMARMVAAGSNAAPTRHSWHIFLSTALADPKSDVAQIETIIQKLERSGYSVHLRTLCLISGRGSLQTWVTRDKLDVVQAAAKRSKNRPKALDNTVLTYQQDDTVSFIRSGPGSTETADVSFAPAATDNHLVPHGSQAVPMPKDMQHVEHKSLQTPPALDDLAILNQGVFGLVQESRETSFEVLQKPSADRGFSDIQSGAPSEAVQDIPSINEAQQFRDHRNNAILHKIRRDLFNAIRRGDLRDASRYYTEFRQLTRIDFEVADAFIRALCWGSLQAPPRTQILQALQVYNDFVGTEKQEAGEVRDFFDGRRPPSTDKQQAYIRIYNTLLRALSTPLSLKISFRDSDPELQEQYTKSAMELLADMKTRGLRPDNRTVSSILLLQFRSAGDHEEAFRYYRSMMFELETVATHSSTVFDGDTANSQRKRSDSPPLLDLFGYRAVLNAFGKLSFPNAPVAPARLWFSIAKDMGTRGHVVTVEDYTIYLGAILAHKTSPCTLQRAAIGLPAAEDEADRMKAIIDCVKHVHKQLTVDPNIAPDATLLNTLMNAYQHLGAFDDALRVFDTIWLSGRMDHVTPIIIFDACGYARRPREATNIWCMLIRKGWQFDKRTLDTWVECLCRLGDVETACKFVCVYMGRDNAGYLSKGDTRPDVRTCLILLKLSWAVGQNLHVKDKIRAHLPHLWNKLAAHYT